MWFFDNNGNSPKYDIIWNDIDINPSVQLKFGIRRKVFPLTRQFTNGRSNLYYVNNYIELKGKWDNSPEFGSLLSLKLKNISSSSIRITRLVFPSENGLNNFLKEFDSKNISFLRNGYQSWSPARSYRIKEKPLRPWLQLVSLTSSNLANLPSNTPGNMSSEMYSVITDLNKKDSFLVGQCQPFNQFFYIRLILFKKESKINHFELVFDFGRKMLKQGETIELDGIVMAKGETSEIQNKYFKYIKNKLNIKTPKNNIKGWSTWYYYYNKISPEIIYNNLSVIKKRQIDIDFIQIDDGYQKSVGDWLELQPQFNGKMKEIANRIKNEGYIPGIWLAPFIAENKSILVKNYPDYILRTEYGKPIVAGYNPSWNGKFYYGLDITNPRFQEYISNVIKTIVFDWGFKYLKLDFLFGGCLRGGNHNSFRLTRSEVLKNGIKLIRKIVGNEVLLVGCGMPLSSGIGLVDIMRVGPDTAPFWKQLTGTFLQTGAMLGARNSMRNFMVRSFMHKNLWLNDPDCLLIRDTKTSLTPDERRSQINAIILSGGVFLYSDNFMELKENIFEEIEIINSLSDLCYQGDAIPLDQMEKEIPEIYYNTAGFIGVFNFQNKKIDKKVNFNEYPNFKIPNRLKDVWTGELFSIINGVLHIPEMPKHSSRLFQFIVSKIVRE